ncbi:unnamed protein product, partial [Meganyctiphanes norvegica]
MLRKLNTYSNNLAKLSDPEKKPILEKEVVEIEQRMQTVIDTVTEKIEYLNQLNVRWVHFTGTLNDLRTWKTNAQNVLERLVTLEMSPESRDTQTLQLMNHISEKMSIINVLESEAAALLEGEPSQEALQFSAELMEVKECIETLRRHTAKHADTVHQDLIHWQAYQAGIKEIRPWIEEAETKVAIGYAKPATIQETLQLSNYANQFEKECDENLEKLRDVSTKSSAVARMCAVRDEVDALFSRWSAIHDVALQWNEKSETLLSEWQEFSSKCEAVTSWGHEVKVKMGKLSENASTPLRLEDRVLSLREIEREIDEKQTDLINLVACSDHISNCLAGEGVTAIKNNVMELKSLISILTNEVHKAKNYLSDITVVREEFINKIDNLESWLNNFSNRLDELQDIDVDELDESPDLIHQLLQDHNERQPTVTIMAEECHEVGDRCTGTDRDELYQKFDDAEARFESYGEVIRSKKPAIYKWKDFWEWQTNSDEALKGYNQILDSKPRHDGLTQIRNEILSLQEQCRSWEEESTYITELCHKSSTTIRDADTGVALDIATKVQELKKRMEIIESNIETKCSQLQQVNCQWETFHAVKNQLGELLNSIWQRCNNRQLYKSSYTGIQHLLQLAEEALKEMQSQQKLKEKVHDLGRSLMSTDSTQLMAVQNAMTAADGNWDRVQNMLYELQTKFTSIESLWKHCIEGQHFLAAAIVEAEHHCEQMDTVPSEASIVQTTMNLCKKTSEALRRTRPQLENFLTKSQHLTQQLDSEDLFDSTSVKQLSSETHNKWQSMMDYLNMKSQNLEGQLILWKQIIQGRDEILNWLNETCEGLDENQGGKETDIGNDKLEKYKNEIALYESQFRGMQSCAKQLESLNGGITITRIEQILSTVSAEFQQTENTSSNLGQFLDEMKEQESGIYEDIKETSEALTQVRERLMRCEDITGDDKQILVRLEIARKIEIELNDYVGRIREVKTLIEELKSSFKGCDITKLIKEFATLQRKYDGIIGQTAKACKSLQYIIEKHYFDRLEALQRFVANHQEKVEWCKPEAGSDRFGVEAKITALEDVKSSHQFGKAKRLELEKCAELYEKVIMPDQREIIRADCNKVISELENLNQSIIECSEILTSSLDLWQQYEQKTETLSYWLRDIESKMRSETMNQIDMNRVNIKISETENILIEVNNHYEDVNELIDITNELMKLNPDARAAEYSNQLKNRVESLNKFCHTFLDKLNQLLMDQQLYDEIIIKMQDWLKNAEEKLYSFEQMTKTSGKPTLAYQSKLQNLKAFVEEKRVGQELLNAVVEHGEALFSAITPEGRETIRKDLRSLRDTWEAHLERVNHLYKQVEGVIMQWSSFDDNFSQAAKWLEEIMRRAGGEFAFRTTLSDKKAQLQHLKAIAQDINSHEGIITGLKDKIEFLPDDETSTTVDSMISQHKSLLVQTQQRIVRCEGYIQTHEEYVHYIEQFRDWLSTQKTELSRCIDIAPESSDVQMKNNILQNLEENLEDGQELLTKAEEALSLTLDSTDPNGHSAVEAELQVMDSTWTAFQEEICDTKHRVEGIMSEFNECEDMVYQLKLWMKNIESKVKDQSLKSSLDAKLTHLDRLRKLEEEILNKADEFNAALTRAHTLDNEGKHAVQISQLSSRYQALRNVLKEMMSRYEQFIKEHSSFLDKYEECMEWLEAVDHDLREHAEVVGDMKILQMRRNKVEQLIEIKSTQANKVDSLLELGERLYSHTAPDGRENIRQMLRDLRDRWDAWSTAVTTAGLTLDECLQQFADFSAAQEQLTRWLRDVELAMQQHTELKSSLQEKTAQLQNHRLVHQEIQAHQTLVEMVCEKAQALVNQTQDKTLNIYIQSIKTLFHNIVLKSRDLLEKLDLCVQDHAQFNALCKSFGDWLNVQRDQLHLCADCTGEKSDLTKKLENLKFGWNCLEKFHGHNYGKLSIIALRTL